jgi:hypothetical protein
MGIQMRSCHQIEKEVAFHMSSATVLQGLVNALSLSVKLINDNSFQILIFYISELKVNAFHQ